MSQVPYKRHQPQQLALPFESAETHALSAKNINWRSLMPAHITPSSYQEAIFDFVLYGQGDGLVNAVAGAGKTWTLVQAARIIGLLPGVPSATFAAFNRHIAEALKDKLRGTPMRASTIHSMGYNCLIKHLHRKPVLDDTKYATLTKTWVETEVVTWGIPYKLNELNDIAYGLLNLVKFARLTLTPPDNAEALQELTARFDITVPDFVLPGVAQVLQQGEDIAADQHIVDYSDMLWLPYRWQLQPPPVDFLFVDEAQDLSPAQLDLVLKSRSERGRMLFVGDPAQSIMAFAGADARAFWNIKEHVRALELPLSICYRCPRSHIEVAQKLVPHILPRPDAPPGVIDSLPEEALPAHVQNGDLILCRMTAPLVAWCIRLIQQRIYARVRGVDVGASLVSIVKRVSEMTGFAYSDFGPALGAYEAEQRMYLSQRKNNAGRVQSLKDKCDAVRACYESFQAQTVDELCKQILALFSDDKTPVWLSTVHRAKGLENDTVYILQPHKLPLEWADQQAWEWEQELNLRYVAVTRAKQRLVLLQPEGMNVDYTDTYIEEKIAKKQAEYAEG